MAQRKLAATRSRSAEPSNALAELINLCEGRKVF
jgi:hypothetical protein